MTLQASPVALSARRGRDAQQTSPLAGSSGRFPMTSNSRLAAFLLAVMAVVTTFSGPTGHAQEPAIEPGIFVTVQNPITSDEMNRVREKVERAVAEKRV